MLVYEKDNKLNINFDNEISENPDIQFSQTGISVDGEPIGGGGSNLPDIDWTDLTNGAGQLFACRRNGIVFLNNPGTAMTNFALTELPEEFVPEDGDGYGGVIVAPFFSSNYAATIVGRLLIEYGSGVGNISYHAAPNETGNGSMFISYPAKINNTNT